ncbi:WD40 repeat domain-containing protein [Streptomyces sp. NPDC004752]
MTAVVDGRLLAVTSADYDASLHVWDLTTGRPLCDALRGHRRRVSALAVTTLGGRALAVSGGEDSVRVWDLAALREAGPPLPVPYGVRSLAAFPGGRCLCGGDLWWGGRPCGGNLWWGRCLCGGNPW